MVQFVRHRLHPLRAERRAQCCDVQRGPRAQEETAQDQSIQEEGGAVGGEGGGCARGCGVPGQGQLAQLSRFGLRLAEHAPPVQVTAGPSTPRYSPLGW